MRKYSQLTLLSAAVATLVSGAACSEDSIDRKADNAAQSAALPQAQTEAAIGDMSVAQLAQRLKAGQACTALDANSPRTRAKLGTVPNATLLSHYSQYKLDELPASKDQTLVFYCSNTQCGASHAAAEKAVVAGYTDVHVMSAGIMGWREAGQPVAALE
jgi:rhodanese-related sulfurtransferase